MNPCNNIIMQNLYITDETKYQLLIGIFQIGVIQMQNLVITGSIAYSQTASNVAFLKLGYLLPEV
jgi:hypothetical protein